MKWPIMRYICDTQDSGYGNAARGYMQAFKALGIGGDTLRVVPVMAPTHTPALMNQSEESHGPFSQSVVDSHNPMTGQDPGVGAALGSPFDPDDPFNPYISGAWPGDDQINMVHLNPGMLHVYHTPLNGRYNIAITAWETDRLTQRAYKWAGEDRTMAQDINDYDEVWVPTSHVKKVLEGSGVTKPIFVIPHVLREEVLALQPKSPGQLKRNSTVGFYSIGPWNPRKNHLDLLRAYYGTGWTIQDKVRLQLFSLPVVRDANSLEAHEWIANDNIRHLRETCAINKLDLPALNLMGSPRRFVPHIKQAHMINHVLITASRGEGFYLPALDAVALGNYVAGGFPALSDLRGIAPSSVNVLPSRKVPITPMPEVAGYEIDHEWWETSIKDLIEEFKSMRDFVFDEGMAAKHEVEDVRDFYCPSTVGKLIQQRLEHAADVVESTGW